MSQTKRDSIHIDTDTARETLNGPTKKMMVNDNLGGCNCREEFEGKLAKLCKKIQDLQNDM